MIPLIKNLYPTARVSKQIPTNNKPNQRINLTTKPDVFELSFSGKSMPSEYYDVFDYMAAEILGGNKKYNVDGSMLSASKINQSLDKLYDDGNLFLPYKLAKSTKIKWKNYIPEDVRQYSIDKINSARDARMAEWRDFLENTNNSLTMDKQPRYASMLVEKVEGNPSLKLVIWNAVSSELKENNRHIPVPFNEKALLETIMSYEEINPKYRAVRCASPTFLEMYTHRLRDNLLMDMNLSNNDAIWVKIPSIKHDPENREENIRRLEILSNRNWCTRSSVDKAEDALLDGDFYIYLARKSKIWEPQVGMASCKGKIDQIQGAENNNFIPLPLLSKVKEFIETEGLKTQSIITDEGPKASVAIMIGDKLNEVDLDTKKSFSKAIKEDDIFTVLKFLQIKNKVLENGNFEIYGYKPSYLLDHNRGCTVPYSMLGIDEDKLLKDVEVINGNFILWNRNDLYSSKISQFPLNLQKVTGRIECSKKQYEKFKPDMLRVVDYNEDKIKVH